MNAYIKKNFLHLLIAAVFVAGAVFGIIAAVQHIHPIASIISSQVRVSGILTDETAKAEMAESIAMFSNVRAALLILYASAVVFFLFMAAVRVLKTMDKPMPKIALPVLAGANILLLIAAAALVGGFAGGLGLSPAGENYAAGYSWYDASGAAAGSRIMYFAPTFWTVVFPLIFIGIIPLINGLKAFFSAEN